MARRSRSPPTRYLAAASSWTVSDITARVQAEREVQRRAEVLGATLNAARQGIILFDAEGHAIAANDLAGQLTNSLQRATIIGPTHVEIVKQQYRFEGADDAELRDVAERISAVDRRLSHRYQRARRDGIVLDISSDPMPEGGYVVCISDVTELVRAREQAQA